MNLEQEKKLIREAQKDAKKFGELYEAYYDAIFGYVFRRILHRETAEELVSNVFFRAMQKLWQFRWQQKPFGCWLFRIANNEMNRYFRQYRPPTVDFYEIRDVLAEKDSGFEQRYAAFERIHQAMQQLPLREQTLLALRYFERKTIKEISLIVNISESNTKTRLHRSKQKIKHYLEEH